jgi:hypothetical protein
MPPKFLSYPVKQPINESNLFGANPAQYEPLGQKGHPGLDFEAPSGTPLYTPCDGDAFYTTDANGGDGIWIRYPITSNIAKATDIHIRPTSFPSYPQPVTFTDPVRFIC